jgi:molybdopterin-guanine dinucleotide biosynthesis protein A
MKQQRTLAAAIFAGGQARHLGHVNKSTLALGRTEIVDRQLLVLRDDPHGLNFMNVNTPHDYERARDLLDLSFDSNHESPEDRITSARSRT